MWLRSLAQGVALYLAIAPYAWHCEVLPIELRMLIVLAGRPDRLKPGFKRLCASWLPANIDQLLCLPLPNICFVRQASGRVVTGGGFVSSRRSYVI